MSSPSMTDPEASRAPHVQRPTSPRASLTEPSVVGEVALPSSWVVFAPAAKDDPAPPVASLARIPQQLTIGKARLDAQRVTPVRGQYDFRAQLGEPPTAMARTAYVFVPLHVERAMRVTLGLGWDHWLQAWLNGEPLFDGEALTSAHFPPSMRDRLVTVDLQAGENVLAVRVVSGRGACVLAMGGPRDLRAGDFRSVLDDPLRSDARWSQPALQAQPAGKSAVEVGTRRELFIDDDLIDAMTGTAERRLHRPVPREVVLTLDKPWEGNCSGNFLPVTVLQDAGRVWLYYYAPNWQGPQPLHKVAFQDRHQWGEHHPVSCLAESSDGIHFTRPNLGLHETFGSTNNNIVWAGRPHLAPFKDANPDAPEDQRYKAVARHPDGGLGAYASPDGIHWRMLVDRPIITKGAFDSQNLAFWDAERGCYVEYHRGQPGDVAERGIMTGTSVDFIHWSEPESVQYTDDRREHMYTNCIQPYFRAPHIKLGTPARFIGHRMKDPDHNDHGISDSILMASRDGRTFERWEEAFLRPNTEPEAWTDRNNYLAWGMAQTSAEELSFYWCEHNGHPGVRLRRGTLRTDGFVSVHAPGRGIGEMLTRPMRVSGSRLEVNYETSAAGTMIFELCDEAGRAIEGFSLADSETLYGNAIAHTVTWRGAVQDVSHLAGRPVRLRVRMHDADLYSLRFHE